MDRGTSTMVLRATVPMVLYRDNSAKAAFARDFAYLGPIEVNRMGEHSYYLWLGIWSTISDDERLSRERDGFESAVLFVDGEPMSLELAGWAPDAIGLTEPVYVKPVASAADAYYRVTLDQVRLLATAAHIELRTGAARPGSYVPWDDQGASRASIQEFVAYSYR